MQADNIESMPLQSSCCLARYRGIQEPRRKLDGVGSAILEKSQKLVIAAASPGDVRDCQLHTTVQRRQGSTVGR